MVRAENENKVMFNEKKVSYHIINRENSNKEQMFFGAHCYRMSLTAI